MISLDAYRVSIGNFNGTRQLDLRSIYRHLVLHSCISSKGLSRILKPAPFLFAALLYLSIILTTCGDIETNPGPVNLRKVVRASFHQGNAIFGPQAGTQCMYMSTSAIIYSHLKPLREWERSDLDIILRLGNDLYRGLGYTNEYIDLTDLPSQLIIENDIIEFQRTPVTVSVLDQDSRGFINPPLTFSCGIFLSCSNGTAFMCDGGLYYIYDSHS